MANLKNKMEQKIETTKIALFKGRKIRRTIYQNEWWLTPIILYTLYTLYSLELGP